MSHQFQFCQTHLSTAFFTIRKKNDHNNLKKCLVFYCNMAWPQYKLGDQEQWPINRSSGYNTIPQLDLLYRRKEK